MWLRILIPKTGCYSRSTALGDILPADFVACMAGGSIADYNPWRPNSLWNRDKATAIREWNSKFDWVCASGKNTVGWHTPVELFDECPLETTKTTFLRNPVTLTISHYYFFGLNKELYPKTPTLEEFAHLPHVTNQQTVYTRSLDEFDFVGLFENLQQDFAAMLEFLGFTPVELPYTNHGINKAEREKLSRDSGVIAMIEAANAKDVELYNRAKESRDRRLRSN